VPLCAKPPAAGGLGVASGIHPNGARRPFGSDARSGSSFPPISSRAVAYWLLGSAASVFGIVVFGGLTRLTESGSVPIHHAFRTKG
jgi:hypothetical protein